MQCPSGELMEVKFGVVLVLFVSFYISQIQGNKNAQKKNLLSQHFSDAHLQVFVPSSIPPALTVCVSIIAGIWAFY